MHKAKRCFWVFSAAVLVAISLNSVAYGADFVLSMKSGTVFLWDRDQRIDGVERKFDEHSRKSFGLAWEIRNAKGVGMGMEYLYFRNKFTPSSDGRTRSQILTFNVKKYFSPGGPVHPYAGGGFGWGHAKYDDGVGNVDRDLNLVFQGMLGIEFRFADAFGFFTEARALASGADGEEENEFDFSGTGVTAGINFIF